MEQKVYNENPDQFFIKMYEYNDCIFFNSLAIAPKEK